MCRGNVCGRRPAGLILRLRMPTHSAAPQEAGWRLVGPIGERCRWLPNGGGRWYIWSVVYQVTMEYHGIPTAGILSPSILRILREFPFQFWLPHISILFGLMPTFRCRELSKNNCTTEQTCFFILLLKLRKADKSSKGSKPTILAFSSTKIPHSVNLNISTWN